MISRLTTALGSTAIALIAQQALAHHGWGGQIAERFELSGTVHTAVSLAGPHATMKIQDADGQVWDLTLAPPRRTSGAGLDESIIPIGAEVSIVGNRNADMDRHEVKTMRVTYNGKNYDVYASRL